MGIDSEYVTCTKKGMDVDPECLPICFVPINPSIMWSRRKNWRACFGKKFVMVGKKCNFTCKKGLTKNPKSPVECTKEGWNPSIPNCGARCTFPNDPELIWK